MLQSNMPFVNRNLWLHYVFERSKRTDSEPSSVSTYIKSYLREIRFPLALGFTDTFDPIHTIHSITFFFFHNIATQLFCVPRPIQPRKLERQALVHLK